MEPLKRRIIEYFYPEIISALKQTQQLQILHHFPQLSGHAKVVEKTPKIDDQQLVERIMNSFRKAIETQVGNKDSIWLREFETLNSDVHTALKNGSAKAVTELLRNPAGSMLFFGFESIQSRDAPQNRNPSWVQWQHRLCYDNLLQIAAASGLYRVQNPEAPLDLGGSPDVEEILKTLDDLFGFKVDFPNIYPEEIGLETTRGVANYRAIQALYQAWRIQQIIPGKNTASVCEIGGGLGRTAYYARRMGIHDYTIIDLPLTGVSQAYFLGRTVGEENISLHREPSSADIKIVPPVDFHNSSGRFDLIVNFDSMTEMAEETARKYLDVIGRRTSKFFSINHEANKFTVAELLRTFPSKAKTRNLSWSRRGYVEEYVEIAESA